MNDKRQIKQRLKAFKPDIVGFECSTGMQWWVKDIAAFIKKEINKDILVIVGGPHPTFFPEVIEEKEIDIICQGEGEYATLDLANRLDAGEDITTIKNLLVKIDGKISKNPMRLLIQELDRLPTPDRELYEDYKYVFKSPYHHFIASRGCPYDCTFCYNHAFRKMQERGLKYVRRRSVNDVIEELMDCKKKHRMNSVVFLDDTFASIDRNWMFSFMDTYKEKVKIPFFCLLRANQVDEELVKGLKDSGCYWVTIGVETGDESYRSKILRKNLKDSDIINAARLFHKHKLKFNTANMLGLPNETLEGAIQTLTFNSKIKPAVAWCCLFQPYPKTPLGEYCLENRLIDKLDGSSIDVHSHTSSPLKQKDIREVENLHKFAHIAVKLPFLMPVIRKLIKLPMNVIFVCLYRITYLIFYWAGFNKLNFGRMYQEAVIAFKYYREGDV